MCESADPPPVPGGWARQAVAIGDHRLRLWVPAVPEALLDDGEVQARNARDDYMPYWAWLWDAAPRMAELVLAERWPTGARALELGAGLGLVGLAAARAGLAVTLSDHDTLAVELAERNAAENAIGDCRAWPLDWRALDTAPRERFPVVLGCDVAYEEQAHAPLLDALARFLAPGGVAWIGDPGRSRIGAFCDRAQERGFRVEARDAAGVVQRASGGGPGPAPYEFRLLVLRRCSEPVATEQRR